MNSLTRRASLALLAGAAGLAGSWRVLAGAPLIRPQPAADPLTGLTLRADQVNQMRAALAAAPDHGLISLPDPTRDALLASPNPVQRSQGVGMLVGAVLAYAKALRSGGLPSAKFPFEWGLRPEPYDPASELALAVQADRLNAWFADLPPPYTGYDDLRQGLRAYRAIQAAGGWAALPTGAVLKLGSTGARVDALRQRLALEDPQAGPVSGAPFDASLEDDLMRAQRRYGLEPTGRLDRATQAALDTPVERRIDQILANMERWRWMPRTMPDYRVQVNVAAAVLTLFNADQPTLSMRAATGAPGHETPMLQSQIDEVVFNPPWNVPTSIANAELWPKERASPGYLARNGYKVVGGSIVQPAGPRSALGKIKFDFDNPYSVYLHDTPSRGAFEDYERLISHGCVRLQKPEDLLMAVMQGDPHWTPQLLHKTYADKATLRAKLAAPVGVYLLYWTAYRGPDGMMNFRDDPYGWDARLTRLMA